uniref:PDZ domain-containing protein n=1 Tax=Oryzias latipes TaxID=8090 RepID=A0A3P9HMH2_ORYLA
YRKNTRRHDDLERNQLKGGVIVRTPKDGCAEGLVYSGGGKEGIFIKEVVPESPASKSLKVKEGDQILSATVYFDNVPYEDAIQILEHAQAYKVKLCLKRKPDITETEPGIESDIIPVTSKFKMPKLGIKMSKIKGPELDLGLQKMDADVTQPKAEVQLPKVSGTGVPTDVSMPDKKTETEEPKIKPQQSDRGKFKMPSLGFSVPKGTGAQVDVSLTKPEVDVTLQGIKKEVQFPDSESKKPSVDISTKAPGIEIETRDTEGSPSKFQMPTFELPKSGHGSAAAIVPADVKLQGPDAYIKEMLSVTLEAPTTDTPTGDIKTIETERAGKGGKFKMPSLGFSVPKGKEAKVDLSLTKPEVDLSQQETKVEVQVSDTELEKPSVVVKTSPAEIKLVEKETKGSPSKFKMPTFKLPKFGLGKESDIKVPEEALSVTIEAPSTDTPTSDIKTTETEQDGKGGKFKMPSLGFSVPKVKGPEVDVNLTKPEVNLLQQETKVEVQVSDTELEKSPVDVNISSPDIKLVEKETKGSPSKFKMPTFNFPKFGLGSAAVDIPAGHRDIEIEEPDIKVPEEVLSVTIEAPSTDSPSGDIKTTATEQGGKGGKFKMPSLGFSVPKGKEAKVDLSLTKPEVDLSLQETKVEVKVSDTELEKPSVDVKISSPEIKLVEKETKGSPSKFKMPTFKFPKFGLGSSAVDVPAVDKDVKLQEPDDNQEEILSVTIEAPSSDTPLGDIKTTESEKDGKGGKFKMPSLGFSVLKADGSEVDVSLTKPEVDVTLQEIKEEIQFHDSEASVDVSTKAPGIQIKTRDTEGSPSKFKMPTFKLPKFGFGSAAADVRADVKLQGPDDNMEEVLSVSMEAPTTTVPSGDVKTTEYEQDGKEGTFRMPNLGFSVPKVKGPDVDVRIKKEVQFPDPEASVDVSTKAPEIQIKTRDTEGSPSKFKMPTFKLPKFGLGSASADVPAIDKDIKIEEHEIKVPEEILSVTMEAPSTVGFFVPKGKETHVDVSLKKTDVDLSLQENKAGVKVSETELEKPSLDVKLSSPEIKLVEKETKGSPSKFKMPTFKFPKFGLGSAAVDVPTGHRDIQIEEPDIKVPEEALSVTIEAPSTDTPTGDIKTTETEQDGKGGKFKMPSLGFSVPKVKGPEVDVNLTKPEVDLLQQETQVEVQVSDTELEKPPVDVKISSPEIKLVEKETKGSPSKFKMPTFNFPKFGLGSAAVDIPAGHRDIEVEEPDIKVPEEALSVTIEAPSTDSPSGDIKTTATEQDGKGGKFKMPSLGFSVPKVKGLEVDVNLTKPEVDLLQQETKVEVQVSDTELEKPPVDVKISSPEIKLVEKETKGSPSKFKMPTFKFPKFGLGSSAVDVPAVDKDVKLQEPDDNQEEILSVTIEAPSSDTPLGDIKTTESEKDGKGGKFKMPSLGFSVPKADGTALEGDPVRLEQPADR